MAHFNDNQFYLHPRFIPEHPDPLWAKDADYVVPVVSPVGAGPKGEKGDPAYFDDLTDEQKAEIYKQVSYVGNEVSDAIYVTSIASTTTIPIPVVDYDEYDMLWVFVEGLMLLEHIDYTISNGSIILDTPITHEGTKVLFRALRFSTPDGNKELHVDQDVHNTINNIYNAAALTGSGVPTIDAEYIGQMYIDTENNDVYVAKSESGDWIQI